MTFMHTANTKIITFGLITLLLLSGMVSMASALSNSGGGEWNYYREITIKEESGTALSDYQVLVELNPSNFPDKAKSDGSDIRFSADDEELNYWIEEWDYGSQNAKIWVKVSSIPASGGTKVKMYYVNPSATSFSDGDATFDLFDDFEGTNLDANKWEWFQDGSGTNYFVANGYLELTGMECGTGSSVRSKSTIRRVNKIIDSRWQVQNNDPGRVSQGFFKLPDESYGTGWAFDVPCWSNRAGWIINGDQQVSCSYLPGTTWHIGKFVVTPDSVSYYQDGMLIGTRADPALHNAKPTNVIAISHWCGGYVRLDWIHIRKYASSEPSPTISAEYPVVHTALTLTKTASPYPIKQEQKTTVKITVENTGTTAIRDIEVTDSAPADFDFISGETSNKYDMLKAGESRTFQYIIQSRDAGKFGICQATATYADEEGNYHTVESDHAMVEVIASLTTPEIPAGTPVPTLVTSTSTTSTPLPPGTPQITISQTSLLEEPSVGDEAMITVSLKNTGNSIAENVQLTERIPSSVSVSYVEGADNAGGLVSWSGDLNPGQSRSIQHTFRILEAKNRFFTAKVTYEDADGNKKETSTNVYITTAAEQPAPLDSDGDGWNDELETKAGTNPYVKDSDNDGLWDPQDPNPLMAQETETPGLPGFEAIFAVVGLLVGTYVLRRR